MSAKSAAWILSSFSVLILLLLILSARCQPVAAEEKTVNHEKAKYTERLNRKHEMHFEEWMSRVEAARRDFVAINVSGNPFKQQIKTDLEPFKAGITLEAIERSKEFGVHYQVIDKKLFRQKDCMFPARCEGIEHFLTKTAKVLLDSEFVINVRDWPQVDNYRGRQNQSLPIFSFSKDRLRYLDILYPAWSFWSGGPAIDPYPRGIGRWDMHRELLKSSGFHWSNKSSIAFFRGSRTSHERDPLIHLSRKHSQIVDAKYTKNQSWRSKSDTLGEDPAPMVPFEDQCRYKYLFNLRGVAASFRHRHLFLCNSVVLDVESDWIEFYYHKLKAWTHFVPLKRDLTDAVDILTFLQANDEVAQQIAEEGFKFIWENLTMKVIQRYWDQLMKGYQKLLQYAPQRLHNLVEIKS